MMVSMLDVILKEVYDVGQAYTQELELKVSHLEEENKRLRRKLVCSLCCLLILSTISGEFFVTITMPFVSPQSFKFKMLSER